MPDDNREPGSLVPTNQPGVLRDPATGMTYFMPSSLGSVSDNPADVALWESRLLAEAERTTERDLAAKVRAGALKAPVADAPVIAKDVESEMRKQSGYNGLVNDMANALDGWYRNGPLQE